VDALAGLWISQGSTREGAAPIRQPFWGALKLSDRSTRHRALGARRAPLAVVAALLATVAVPVYADATNSSAAASSGNQPPDEHHEEIIVTGQLLFRDVRPERSLDEDAVASYGVSTVDELIEELQSEFDEGEDPVFVVNGQRVYDLDDISAYPVEIIKQLQVLPRGSAPQVGGSPTQRVFNLTLQKRLRSATATVASRTATEGDWHAHRGEAILTSVDGPRRGNVALRVRGEGSLRENQRGIIQPTVQVPFATNGNVIAYPDLSGEIDPLLSDAAGTIVTVAPIPGGSTPSLADFAAQANVANADDRALFRSLRPELRSYDFNGTYTTPLTSWLTSTTTFRLGQSTSRSLIGLATGLFVLDVANPFSPFSVPVALAVAGPNPLRSRYRRDTGEANLTLTASIGNKWYTAFNGRHSWATDTTDTQRSDSFAAVLLDDSVNPFASDLGGLVGVSADHARSRHWTTSAQLTLGGSPLRLPAGDLNTTFEGRLGWQSLHSRSSFTGQQQNFRRSEQAARAVVQVPIASRRNGFIPALGELNATVEYSRIHFSDSGNAHRTILGLAWEPIEALRLRGSLESVKEPAPIELLGAPTVQTPLVRVFDPLTGDTVEVLYVSGGNPDLKPQSTETRSASAIVRLVPSLGLQLNAEYTDIRNRNFVSGLPPASEAVMLAFPDRFVRAAGGTLVLVDVRPVNFARHHQQRLRWGFSLNAPLGRGGKGSFGPAGSGEIEDPPEAAAAAAVRRPPTRLQLTASHSIVFKDEILIRPGLDPVDLLNGGAIGIAGGRVRHQLEATAAVTSGGTGIRVGATWLGSSTLDTRIDSLAERLRFSPLLTFNLKAFADARRLFPHSRLAKATRFSLSLINLTNDRQRVRDSLGNTPLQYQPAYRDPLGRTIEFEIRKVF
jgi:iron complex outermembrane recepter protein